MDVKSNQLLKPLSLVYWYDYLVKKFLFVYPYLCINSKQVISLITYLPIYIMWAKKENS